MDHDQGLQDLTGAREEELRKEMGQSMAFDDKDAGSSAINSSLSLLSGCAETLL